MQHGLYFEDFEPGKTFYTERRRITETDVVNFVSNYSYSEPLFMDWEYVEKETPFERPIAPALLTVSMADGLSVLSGIMRRTGMAFLGMELNIKAPVFIGDMISVEIEFLNKRETKKEDRGIVTFLHRVVNQSGETVIEYKVTRMIKRRSNKS
jgi:acyl dehydratase